MTHFVDSINNIREYVFECSNANLLRKMATLLHAIADVAETQADIVEEKEYELLKLRKKLDKKATKNRVN